MSWLLWVVVAVVAHWLVRPVRVPAQPLPSSDRPYLSEVDGDVGSCVLFLDFDGVLHPGNSATFSSMAMFVRLLDARPDWQVVITSDWRLSHGLEQLRALFPERVRARIVGTTPYFPEQSRLLEIENFLTKHDVKQFVILDDNAELFSKHIPQLMLIPNETGLQERQFQDLLGQT